MSTFVFVTYVLALIAVAMALYAMIRVSEIAKEMKEERRKQIINKRLEQVTQSTRNNGVHYGKWN